MLHIFVTLLSLFTISSLADDFVVGPVLSKEPVKPLGLPDLTVSALAAPRHLGEGTYVVDVTVRNIGRGWARASNLLFWDIQSQYGQRRQVGPISGRGKATMSFYVSAPENQGGFYYSASADYGNAVRETSETNNLSTFHE